MPVFLSHKKEDTSQALLIASFLKSKNVKYNVDVIDPELKSTDELTDLLLNRIKICTHLIAVVSDYTIQNWWLPFAIGAGSELDRRIILYRSSHVVLPDFLKKWPILASKADLEKFAELYRSDRTVPLNESRLPTAAIQKASEFHTKLKGKVSRY